MVVHNAEMSKYTVKQLVIAIVVVALLTGAPATAQESTEESIHAYNTTSSSVKAGFWHGLLAMVTFLSRAMIGKSRR